MVTHTEMKENKFRSRRFIITLGFASATIGGLFFDKLDGNEFYLSMGVVLAGYGFTRSKFVKEDE